jgi:hypothetical protein
VIPSSESARKECAASLGEIHAGAFPVGVPHLCLNPQNLGTCQMMRVVRVVVIRIQARFVEVRSASRIQTRGFRRQVALPAGILASHSLLVTGRIVRSGDLCVRRIDHKFS